MGNQKQYRVIRPGGVVGFNGVVHAAGEIISSATAPEANIRAWHRFNDVEEIDSDGNVVPKPVDASASASPASAETADATGGKKGKGK